jgi:DNA-binding FrmR family transcriptional regulator
MPDQSLAEQAKVRLRRIEGQVRGIQGMLDRMAEDPASRQQLAAKVERLLAAGTPRAEVARSLGLSGRRVAELARGGAPEPVPCDSLLTQILAVRAAVDQVGLLIMELHLQQCVLDGLAMDDERSHDLHEALKLWSRLSATSR